MRSFIVCLSILGTMLAWPDASWAEQQSSGEETLPPVVVTGEDLRYGTVRRTEVTSDPRALPAPTTILGSQYLEQIPVTTYGDVFRNLPGIDVNNFGQGGIGYGIAIRGFTDAEHGRDVAYFIDGVPLNEVSSVHTPNYADLNILIPETVERIEIIRGPFSALYGDSNLGGAVNIITKRYQPYASLGASGGSFTTSRGIATYGQAREDAGSLKPFLAYEGSNTDGYRNNQGFKHYDLFNKVTLPTKDGDLSLRAQFYGGDWGAPSYIRRDLVQSGVLSPKAAVNSSDGGNKELQNIVLNYDLGEPDQAFTATGFVNHDIFNRYADFGSDQRLQDENRTMYGLTLRKAWTDRLFGAVPAQLLIGLNWRDDSVHVHQYPTLNRMPNGPPVKDLDFNEQGLGEFLQVQIKPLSWLKVTAGGRYDHFWYDMDDRLATMSVPKSDTGVLSPKAGVAITPVSWLEIFANYGEGFRSPSAVDDLLTTPNLKPLKLRSQEMGLQVQPNKRVRFLADVWSTSINNEIFQPAPGLPVQNLGRSLREGYDLEGRYYVLLDSQRELSVFANYTQIRAVLRDRSPSVFVPNVPASIVNVGTEWNVPVGGENTPHRFLGSVSAQLVGKKHLTEDGVITTSPYERLAARLGYSYRNQWTAFIDAIWYPTDRLSETAFNFGNAVGASPSDIVVNPQAPVTILVGLSYRFKTS